MKELGVSRVGHRYLWWLKSFHVHKDVPYL